MAGSYVDFVEPLIYGSTLAPNPNHEAWLALGLTGGTDWLTHHVDRMLAAYEAWLAAEGLPPVTPWDGTRRAPWDPVQDLPPGTDLDGSFTGIATLDQLGAALRTRYTTVASVSREINGLLKAPFSYRFWGYLKWAWTLREKFQGRQVFPTGVVVDRDGTLLSAVEFLDTFNDTHRNWHSGSAPAVAPTPSFLTTPGQRVRRGVLGAGNGGEEFMRFHRENMELFHRWYARTEQPPVVPIDMGRPGGWPPTSPAPVDPPAPWVFNEAAVPGEAAFAETEDINDIGGLLEPSYHVSGHGQNTDIGPLAHNNYVPRFQNWHGWIDAQWWWREPRFAGSDPVTGVRNRVFRPVLQDGSDFPGLSALSIVRDATEDTIAPANAVGGLDWTTGNGTLRMKLIVRDAFARPLRMRLTAEVLDAGGTSVSSVSLLRHIGPAGDHPFDTEFTEDLVLAGAFASDDPARTQPAVGFVNSRIRVTGHLWVPNAATPDDPATSPDPGFVHEDVAYIDLVREKQAPEALVYLNLSTFSEDHVAGSLAGGESRLDSAFYVVVQDRTSLSYPTPVWPAALADEVKGLVLGLVPASGLFDDLAHAPDVVLWQDAVDAPIAGVRVDLHGVPAKEDPTLPPELPQRLTWTYRVIFDEVNDAFTGLAPGDSRFGRIRVIARDRAGNASTVFAQVKFLRAANPYMIDGATPWLSVDTRSFAVLEGESEFLETMTAGRDPIEFLNTILTRLNSGNTGAESFDGLATEGAAAALEYAQAIPNPSTGTPTPIFNFALARVRLRASGGAASVRAFFRLFRYAAPSLLFDVVKGYRSFDDGAGRKVPVLGFESETNGAPLMSIPFFASPRANPTTTSLQDQTDPTNVHDFPAGPTDDRVWYFGAWLDINQPTARLPAAFDNASPGGNGPYPAASLQSLRTLMDDFHQCMVVEIAYDLDPTDALASPTDSDNLAQRNLAILTSDNPGDAATRTVEHSFEIDLARPVKGLLLHAAPHDHGDDDHQDDDHACAACGDTELDADHCCRCCGNLGEHGPLAASAPHGKVSTFTFERLVHDEAMSIAMRTEGGMKLMLEGGHDAVVHAFGAQAARTVREAFPVIFHPTRWQQTAQVMDELMIHWHNLPAQSVVRMFLPGMDAEELASLRNARHAPRTVRPEGGSVLRLDVAGVTYLPIPPVVGERQAAVLTIELPDGVKAGQRFVVDVVQLRAGAPVANGAFRIEIPVAKAEGIVHAVQRGVDLLQERLSLLAPRDRRRPVLARRLSTERRRAAALSARAGVPWRDPTMWTDTNGAEHPVEGMKIRVVLEQIEIVDDQDPWLKGAGEIDLRAIVRTRDNGGREQATRLPRGSGHYKIRSGSRLRIDQVLFEGYVKDTLTVRVDAIERDTFDADDHLGAYTRVFDCDISRSIGAYGPSDERPDAENVGPWRIWYRIERA